MLRRILGFIFMVFTIFAFFQCARRGNPTGGPKDITAPILLSSEPENLTTNFDAKRIRLYFDEYVKLEKIQEQLIVSPPLKYLPEITPQGNARKYIEIILKDTLKENTTYTFNFGQSIVDNNEGNPNSFLTYVFSTGDYIDSLSLTGVVRDAYNQKADEFISVMLYEIDSAYTDSTIYKQPPNYITNTLDSTIIFKLNYLKAGKYALAAIRDEGKTNMFDQKTDKIGFIEDTITLPTDSTYLLTLFKEKPDYNILVPSFVAENRIQFGYQGNREEFVIETLTELPDTVKTILLKDREKDTLNFWFTPYEMDSIIFKVTNEKLKLIDTFSVKPRKLPADTLLVSPGLRKLSFEENYNLIANTPLVKIDTSQMMLTIQDSLPGSFSVSLDTLKNRVNFDFEVVPEQSYKLELFPGAVEDFFKDTNDTLTYNLSTGSLEDFGTLRLNLTGNTRFPMIVQLTNEKGDNIIREIYMTEPKILEFGHLDPSKYMVRVIYDENGNGIWDTGNYLKKLQPEKVSYYPEVIEMRAIWIEEHTFILRE
ncbi:uncharacterized protein (DUF2141 family) [Saonia flava]|uniref:Uncharacterized protein (DUF2141 family) n=1 Tax=Saonia flava TaxID=523696 RepID=A0A846R333_9FLAO|nr:Ig-like domain-containing protein [Saonia flava]NJB71229.1 uncharacterized protein (DUF2141 family) [Saonia flava]